MTFSRRLLTLVIVALMTMPASVVIAQDDSTPESATGDGTAFASGTGVQATLFDERGNPTSTINVTNVELDWAEYDEMFAPEAGKMYVVVTVEHTNLTSRPMQIQPYQVMVIDRFGMPAEPAYTFGAEGITLDAISVESGQTGETRTVYSMWEDTVPMLVIYQPTFEQWAVVYLGDS